MGKISLSFSVFIITFSFISCTKETGLKKIEKLSAADCPRVASLTVEKDEPLYNVTTYAGENFINYVDGDLCKAGFHFPAGICFASDGTIFISDIVSVRKISIKGKVSTFAGGGCCGGTVDGIGKSAKFYEPSEIVFDRDSNLILIDGAFGAIRKINSSVVVSTIISRSRNPGFQDGPIAQARFGLFIASLVIGSDNSIYLYDYNGLIRKISPSGLVSTYAGQKPVNGRTKLGYKDGHKENALFGYVTDMVYGTDGNLYLCDRGNNKIRRITPAGIVETIAEIGATSIVISENGLLYAASRFQVFSVNINGTVKVIAGNGITGYKDGEGSQARFIDIRNMAIYKKYLYLTDGSTIRRMKIE